MSETNVEIGWDEAREVNRANWDDRAALHEEAYGLSAYDDPTHISQVITDDLPVLLSHLDRPALDGLDVVHLQCHIGTDTVSLARSGARVTGLDQSPASLDVARRFAARAGADVTWVESDVLAAREALTGEFDVVYTSIGALCWLADLHRWAEQAAALLKPGGVLYVRDGHPMLYALDEAGPDATIAYRYFGNGMAQQWDDEGTYAGSGTVSHQRSYEWPHPVSEIIGSVLAAGLVLERFDEGDTLPWQLTERMVEEASGYAFPGEERLRIPCTFTLVARRPRS